MAPGALRQDVVFAVRLLRKSPAFTAAAILTIAIAVGLNAAVFSIVNAVMLRPLPVRGADRLAVIGTVRAGSLPLGGVSYPDLQDFRTSGTSAFEDIAGYNVGFAGLRPPGGGAERVLTTWVTGNYFAVLDVRPELGRLILPGEGGPRRTDAVVVLGHATWLRRFGGDPEVIGRTAVVNGRRCTIVGVVPSTFAGTQAFSESEIYLPLNWSGASGVLEERGSRWLHAIGRLRPGVSVGRAQAAIEIVAGRLAREHADTNSGIGVRVVPERLARPVEDAARSNALIASIMLGLATLVLIVGAVNVTNLLLARGIERRRELAIRAALGAGRARLVRQMTVESLVLAAAGGTVGVLFASWTARALSAVRPPGDLPVRLDFSLDLRVLAYAAAVIVICGLAAGLLPALTATRLDLTRMLRRPEGVSRGSKLGLGLRHALVVAEIASAVALVVAAGLFVRSLQRAEHVDFGFAPDTVLNAHMDIGQLGYTEARGRAFFAEVERQVRSIPGVEDIGYAMTSPLGYVRLSGTVEAEGRTGLQAERLPAGFNIVTEDYFRTLGMDVIRGRAFTSQDHERSRRVAVVNRTFAERLWPGEDPLGRRFSMSGADGPWIEVVGMTRTGKYRFLFEEPVPYLYLPAAQHYTSLRVMHLRTTAHPESVASAVQIAIRQLEPDLPLYDVQSMKDSLGGGYGLFLVRAGAVAGSTFGVLGLVLAVVGVFGVMTCAAAQRRHEVGVRMALGATPRQIAGLLLRDGTILVTGGLFTGFAAAFAVAHAARHLLFGISALDVWAFGVAAPVVAGAALIGCGIPAWRMARTDPMTTLKLE